MAVTDRGLSDAEIETSEAFVVASTTGEGEWFRPTGHCRGPWDPDACHAGPPTGLLARESERLVPDQQLTRLTVELVRPVPHAGFRVTGTIARRGRTVSTTELTIVDASGAPVVSARGMHLAGADLGPLPTLTTPVPPLADAVPGPFPIRRGGHDRPMFSGAVEVRYPPDDDPYPGPTRLWMRTVPLVLGEVPSQFQRICALADCGNGVSRNEDAGALAFMNTDLTVQLHRLPVGEWFGIDSRSHWEPNGIGMSDSLLFDEFGPVGRALQSLVIRPMPGGA